MKICNKSQTTKSPATENPPTSKQTTIAKLDSGASANYFRFQDAMHCLDDIHEDDGPSAITPTLETIKATKAGSLPLAQKNLSDDARNIHYYEFMTTLECGLDHILSRQIANYSRFWRSRQPTVTVSRWHVLGLRVFSVLTLSNKF